MVYTGLLTMFNNRQQNNHNNRYALFTATPSIKATQPYTDCLQVVEERLQTKTALTVISNLFGT